MHQPTCYIFWLQFLLNILLFIPVLMFGFRGESCSGLPPPGLPVYNELYILYIAYDKYYSTNSNRNLNASSRKSCNSLRNRCRLEKFINTKPCPIFCYTNLEKCTISLIYHCKTAFQPWPKKER